MAKKKLKKPTYIYRKTAVENLTNVARKELDIGEDDHDIQIAYDFGMIDGISVGLEIGNMRFRSLKTKIEKALTEFNEE